MGRPTNEAFRLVNSEMWRNFHIIQLLLIGYFCDASNQSNEKNSSTRLEPPISQTFPLLFRMWIHEKKHWTSRSKQTQIKSHARQIVRFLSETVSSRKTVSEQSDDRTKTNLNEKTKIEGKDATKAIQNGRPIVFGAVAWFLVRQSWHISRFDDISLTLAIIYVVSGIWIHASPAWKWRFWFWIGGRKPRRIDWLRSLGFPVELSVAAGELEISTRIGALRDEWCPGQTKSPRCTAGFGFKDHSEYNASAAAQRGKKKYETMEDKKRSNNKIKIYNFSSILL